MPAELSIDWNTPTDRDAILAFIAAMGFTSRDAATWDGLSMRAIVARRRETIVGLLPIEFRTVCVGPGRVARAAHQTCVALLPEERGQGLGSQMQSRMVELLPADVELITVYREDPGSRAYAWYRRNGFERRMHIESWEHRHRLYCDVGTEEELGMPTVDPPATCAADTPWLPDAWELAGRTGGLFVDQRERPLAAWLAVHPYRSRYTFEVVPLEEHAYAVVGVGRLHSDRPRLDVLDLVAPDKEDAAELLSRCRDLAANRDADTVRIALSEKDPLRERVLGQRTWEFDLLVKWRRPIAGATPVNWRYASIDFA